MALHVVIAGGGFGGLYAARRLERKLPRHSARITLVAEENYLLYTPLLPGAAAGSLEPRHVVVPLREELSWADTRLARVTGADPAARELQLTTAGGSEEALRYDHLVVALGSVSRVLDVPGLAEYALGFKTLSEAIALRNRAVQHLEIAESLDDPEERRGFLTFVFVGAGYAGLEGIAELQDFVADALERYPRCRLDGTRWLLVEAQERVMHEIPASLAAFATRELRGRGMEIRTGTRIDAVREDFVRLSTGEEIPARTVCWTTGVAPSPVVARLGLPLGEGGRIETDATLRVPGHENVWAVGDAAAVPDPARRGKQACPPTAQHALRQGRLAADNIARTVAGQRPGKFRYRTLGVFVDMGQHKAVATMFGVRIRGLPAWFAARTYHLAAMPGTARRLRLMADWTVGLFFGRASAGLGQLGHPPTLGESPEDGMLTGETQRELRVTVADRLTFREASRSDLRTTFTIYQLAVHHTAHWMGVVQDEPPGEEEIEAEWERRRDMLEFMAAAAGSYWVCEDDGDLVGYGHVCQWGEMEELTELMVLPSHHRRGIGRALLERCWPGDPTPDLGRVVVAAGSPADLTLYQEFGVMPITGHWHLQARVADYLERRSQEIDRAEPAVVVLEAARAVAEWKRLEPPAIGHPRPLLHEFFGRTRTCLAIMDADAARATALCWIGPHGDIGPGVASSPEELVPVVLQALDRVANAREPETFGVFCASDSWWLLRRLHNLGFRVWWPSWVMSSVPLPGLDRYLPTRPPHLL